MLVRGKDYSTKDFLNWNVELTEEQQDIDIQDIEEIDEYNARNEIFTYTGEEGNMSNLYCLSLFTERNIIPKINELIQVLKQLDRKIREER